MLFLLTDAEIVYTLQRAQKGESGLYRVDLPAMWLQEVREPAPQPSARADAPVDVLALPLVFNEAARTVHCGQRNARLSPTQFALLRYVHDHGRAGFEELQDHVWSSETSDNAIRVAVSKLNAALLESGFNIELSIHRSNVSIRKLG